MDSKKKKRAIKNDAYKEMERLNDEYFSMFKRQPKKKEYLKSVSYTHPHTNTW